MNAERENGADSAIEQFASLSRKFYPWLEKMIGGFS